jgi:hypothetical protein
MQSGKQLARHRLSLTQLRIYPYRTGAERHHFIVKLNPQNVFILQHIDPAVPAK